MTYDYEQELVKIAKYWTIWNEWASQKPSLRHPIKYIKWYFSEPKYEEWIKENIK